MALNRAKAVVLFCSVLAVVTLVIVQQAGVLKVKPKLGSAVFKSPKAELKGLSNEQTSNTTSIMTVTPKTKVQDRLNTPTPESTGVPNKQTSKITDVWTDTPKPKTKSVPQG